MYCLVSMLAVGVSLIAACGQEQDGEPTPVQQSEAPATQTRAPEPTSTRTAAATSSPTLTPTPSPVAEGAGGADPEGSSPPETVALFYTLLDQKQFGAAFELLSAGRKGGGSVPGFAAGYRTTVSIVVVDVRDLGGGNVYVVVRAHDLINGQDVVRRFEGTWGLVWESGGWKLDASNIREVASPTQGQYQTGDAYNCSDFATYAEAKAYFDAVPGDPSDLDRDDDGIPCEDEDSP